MNHKLPKTADTPGIELPLRIIIGFEMDYERRSVEVAKDGQRAHLPVTLQRLGHLGSELGCMSATVTSPVTTAGEREPDRGAK